MKLKEIAHSRTGDKGNISIISVIAYKDSDYELIKEDLVTIPRVMAEALVNTGKAEYVRPTP